MRVTLLDIGKNGFVPVESLFEEVESFIDEAECSY